jgi:hypothetical protein
MTWNPFDTLRIPHHDADMRTTLDINDATLAELRAKAMAEGKPFKKLINETLQLGLAAKSRKSGRFQVKPLNPGIKPAYQGLSMNQLYDQLEAETPRP